MMFSLDFAVWKNESIRFVEAWFNALVHQNVEILKALTKHNLWQGG